MCSRIDGKVFGICYYSEMYICLTQNFPTVQVIADSIMSTVLPTKVDVGAISHTKSGYESVAPPERGKSTFSKLSVGSGGRQESELSYVALAKTLSLSATGLTRITSLPWNLTVSHHSAPASQTAF